MVRPQSCSCKGGEAGKFVKIGDFAKVCKVAATIDSPLPPGGGTFFPR